MPKLCFLGGLDGCFELDDSLRTCLDILKC